jgi:hypothetical protein
MNKGTELIIMVCPKIIRAYNETTIPEIKRLE